MKSAFEKKCADRNLSCLHCIQGNYAPSWIVTKKFARNRRSTDILKRRPCHEMCLVTKRADRNPSYLCRGQCNHSPWITRSNEYARNLGMIDILIRHPCHGMCLARKCADRSLSLLCCRHCNHTPFIRQDQSEYASNVRLIDIYLDRRFL